MNDPAAIRARHMKLLFDLVRALDPQPRDVLLARLDEDVKLSDGSVPLAWLPVAIDVRATEAIYDVLGAEAAQDFFFRLGVADFESSLIEALVASAIRVFGVEPASLLRWAPRAWAQVFRDETRLTPSSDGPGMARLRYEQLPVELASSLLWMQSAAASMKALLEVTRKQGTVVVEDSDTRARSMTLLFRWQERPTR